MIPCVLLDLDGTLIGRSGQVRQNVWDAIANAQALGIKLAVSTGRPNMGLAQKIAQRVGPSSPHVFQSGAHIAYADGRSVRVSALKESAVQALVRHAREHSLVLELYTPTHLYVERKTPLSEAHARMIGVSALVRDLSEVVANEPVVRAQWVLSVEQEATAMGLALRDVYLSRATSPALPNTYFVSITRDGVSKGSAVEELMQRLGISLAHTMAVGDTVGDLPMLERVGFPVVMGNGEEALKTRFTQIVASVEDDGVAEALKLAQNTRLASAAAPRASAR